MPGNNLYQRHLGPWAKMPFGEDTEILQFRIRGAWLIWHSPFPKRTAIFTEEPLAKLETQADKDFQVRPTFINIQQYRRVNCSMIVKLSM